MADYPVYSPHHRAERVISAGRFALALFLLLAVALDPAGQGNQPALIFGLMLVYLVYAAGVAALTWTSRMTAGVLPLVTHIVDLVLFAVLMRLTERATNPFFIGFVFVVICGALRWYGRGALLTGVAVIAAYGGTTVIGNAILHTLHFDAGRFITRCGYLAMVSGLLAYLGAYQHRLHQEIAMLAAWPRSVPSEEADALNEILTHAANILRTPRVVLAWEEGEEPWLRVASKAGASFELTRERPDTFGTIVAEPLEQASFLCVDAVARSCHVFRRATGGNRVWRGRPLSEPFRTRYAIRSVLALRITSESVHGWLFALDRPTLSSDDFLLGDIVGRLVAGTLQMEAMLQQLRDAVAGEERLRLARELHDGVLQSLTAAALQAQRVRAALATDPAAAAFRLGLLEETLQAEQQSVRLAVEDLKPGAPRDAELASDCAERLRDVATRVSRQWDVQVHLDLSPDVPLLRRRVIHEVSRMLQESLVNAIRHGGAKETRVSWRATDDTACLTVAYRGRGFPGFQGRHDLASLNRLKAGPRTLTERVAALGGDLVIDSSDQGACVEITIPAGREANESRLGP